MQATEAKLKAQIAALLNKANSTDEAEKNKPELGIPVASRAKRAGLSLDYTTPSVELAASVASAG